MYYKDKSKQQTQGTNFPKFRFRNSMGDLLNCHCFTGKCILFSQFSKKIKGKQSPPNKLVESVSVIKNITVQVNKVNGVKDFIILGWSAHVYM